MISPASQSAGLPAVCANLTESLHNGMNRGEVVVTDEGMNPAQVVMADEGMNPAEVIAAGEG